MNKNLSDKASSVTVKGYILTPFASQMMESFQESFGLFKHGTVGWSNDPQNIDKTAANSEVPGSLKEQSATNANLKFKPVFSSERTL